MCSHIYIYIYRHLYIYIYIDLPLMCKFGGPSIYAIGYMCIVLYMTL